MHPWLIVSDPRCGSTLLRRTLDRHPALDCDGEMFHTAHPSYVRPAVDGWAEAIAQKFEESSGWHVQRYQIPLLSNGWEAIASTPGIRVIDLRRNDLTAEYVSWKYAKLSGQWKERGVVPTGVAWDQREFDNVTQGWFDGRKRVAARLRNVPTLRINYEEIAADFADVIRRCLDFLGVEQIPLRPVMQRLEYIDPRTVFVGMPDNV